MANDKDWAMTGANTILHFHEGTSVIGADTLSQPPSGYLSRLLSSLWECLGDPLLCIPLGVAVAIRNFS
jgi:hypothetical protein